MWYKGAYCVAAYTFSGAENIVYCTGMWHDRLCRMAACRISQVFDVVELVQS